MSGYYRTCIKNYAHIAEPLVKLTKKNVKFLWAPEQQLAFDTLKQTLTSDTVMAHPRTDQPYQLYTDACNYAIGAILCQTADDGIERPIVYLSKQLSDTQKRWATIEKEAYAVVYALKQLRPYLMGAVYRTFTDHKPLTSLFTKEMNNTKIQRWSVLLAEYGCKVEYHKGKLNVRADMLSRIKQTEEVATFDVGYWQLGDQLPDLPPDDAPPNIYGLDLHELAQMQRGMTEWTEQHDDDSQYEIINDMLYSTKTPHRYAAEHPRLVIPPQLRSHVIGRAHQDVGHMSVIKTMRKIQQVFIWAGMKADIKSFITKCPTCLVHTKRVPRAPMGEMPIATAPMQIVAADLIGPLVKSPHDNQYILTIIDHCTGWAEAYPIPAKTSYQVWRKFTTQYFPRNGYPDVLITDQGLEFGANDFRNYIAAVGVQQRRTTSYNPQANGKCERFNGTLKQIISCLINNTRNNWEDQLGPALLAYNNSVSDCTGHTPYFLHFGRRARLPISSMLKDNSNLEHRLQHVADALRTAVHATGHSRRYNRERLARRANTGVVKVGDTAIIKAPEPLSLTSKWDPQWTVTKVKQKVVWLTHQQTGKQKTLNINKIKIVDPNITWDELNPRPVRNARKSTRATGLAPVPRNIIQHPADHAPPITEETKKAHAKRRRTHSQSSEESDVITPPRRLTTAVRQTPSVDPQPSTSAQPPEDRRRTATRRTHSPDAPTAHKRALTKGISRPHTEDLPRDNKRHHRRPERRPLSPEPDITGKRPHRAGITRPSDATDRTHPKRLHRQAPRRHHAPDVPTNPKRLRPILPRGVKRSTHPQITPPPLDQQKRARIEIIAALRSLS